MKTKPLGSRGTQEMNNPEMLIKLYFPSVPRGLLLYFPEKNQPQRARSTQRER